MFQGLTLWWIISQNPTLFTTSAATMLFTLAYDYLLRTVALLCPCLTKKFSSTWKTEWPNGFSVHNKGQGVSMSYTNQSHVWMTHIVCTRCMLTRFFKKAMVLTATNFSLHWFWVHWIVLNKIPSLSFRWQIKSISIVENTENRKNIQRKNSLI
jgi:hypothetical protein